jgi:hypothetical protein
MSASQSPNCEWHGSADNEMMRRVKKWLDDGRTLAWLPIWSSENFPEVPYEILYQADQCPERHVWLIEHVEEFLNIPDGITGWLLPVGEKDTDVVVGLWENTLHFVTAVDKRTGETQSLRTGAAWAVDESNASQKDATTHEKRLV